MTAYTGHSLPNSLKAPPRDVIIKFHFYRTKEWLLQAARDHQDLSFQGNPLQLFADLSPVTIAKRRNLKPYLQILQAQDIRYRWGFPFKLSFYHLGRQVHASSLPDLRRHFQDLQFDLPPSQPESSLARPRSSRSLHRSSQMSKQGSQALRSLQAQRFQDVPKGGQH